MRIAGLLTTAAALAISIAVAVKLDWWSDMLRLLRAASIVSKTTSSSSSSSVVRTMASAGTVASPRLLSQAEAQKFDQEMFSEFAFSVDQLMELAGLSVSHAVYEQYPPSTHPRVLACVGPGNNGGDALVAARHLKLFGYAPAVVYPKRPKNQLFQNLLIQCEKMGIPVLESVDTSETIRRDYDVVLDGIFGFSFSGEIRAPFDTLLPKLNTAGVPIVAIDIPSGWDVERGDVSGKGLNASCLVSLTAPKKMAAFFSGPHYLGGRFVPAEMDKRYNLGLPQYPGTASIVRLA